MAKLIGGGQVTEALVGSSEPGGLVLLTMAALKKVGPQKQGDQICM